MKTLQINNKHYQECDLVMLPTNKESRLQLTKNFLNYTVEPFVPISEYTKTQHLYILSNDEIKEGDWIYRFNSNDIFKADSFLIHLIKQGSTELCKKIIATTDSSLEIFDRNGAPQYDPYGLPQIPQSFIEYFISEYNKSNVISKVLVEVERVYKNEGKTDVYWEGKYKIKLNQNNEISILTEPTIDNNAIEAAKKYINLPLGKEMDEEERYFNSKRREYDAFLAGVIYQQNLK